MKNPLLEVREIDTFYGLSQALFGVGLELREAEVVCLLGRNGAGKTTSLRSIMGLTPPRRGRVMFDGRDITGWRPDEVCRAGIGWVPEDRRIFGRLTVDENLRFAAESCPRPGTWSLERIDDMFPKLKMLREHLGTQLSGGEQQMLAIGRTLAVNPRVVLLDEPCEGLAPLSSPRSATRSAPFAILGQRFCSWSKTRGLRYDIPIEPTSSITAGCSS